MAITTGAAAAAAGGGLGTAGMLGLGIGGAGLLGGIAQGFFGNKAAKEQAKEFRRIEEERLRMWRNQNAISQAQFKTAMRNLREGFEKAEGAQRQAHANAKRSLLGGNPQAGSPLSHMARARVPNHAGRFRAAQGGVVPGVDQGFDSVPALLRPEEGVLPPDVTDRLRNAVQGGGGANVSPGLAQDIQRILGRSQSGTPENPARFLRGGRANAPGKSGRDRIREEGRTEEEMLTGRERLAAEQDPTGTPTGITPGGALNTKLNPDGTRIEQPPGAPVDAVVSPDAVFAANVGAGIDPGILAQINAANDPANDFGAVPARDKLRETEGRVEDIITSGTEASLGRLSELEGKIGEQFGGIRGDVSGGFDNALGSLAQGMGQARGDIQQGFGGAQKTLGDVQLGLGDVTADPGFQFELEQGQRAINAARAAGGGRSGGRAAKELQQFSQGLAATHADRAIGRNLQLNQQRMGQAGALAGLQAQGGQALGGLAERFGGASAGLQAQRGQALGGIGLQEAGAAERLGGLGIGINQASTSALGNLAAEFGMSEAGLLERTGLNLAGLDSSLGNSLSGLFSGLGGGLAGLGMQNTGQNNNLLAALLGGLGPNPAAGAGAGATAGGINTAVGGATTGLVTTAKLLDDE